ncbi:MAG: beta-galactosidase [Myxococcota bacterium]
MKVEFDRYSLLIDGRRRLIRSGSLHYFRLPAENLWRERLEQFRAAGLNTVDLYYPWNYHSRAPGEYDFSDIRDLDRVHDMIEEAGLYLIARPGPYICAEIDMGGLPAWLLRDPSMVLRCRRDGEFIYSREFLAATRQWFEQVVPRFATRPNLLLVQMENEYAIPGPLSGFSGDFADLLVRWFGARGARRVARVLRLQPRRTTGEARGGADGRGQTNRYVRELYELLRELGVEVPISHNDVSAVSGRQMDADLLSIDRYPVTSFGSDWRDDPKSFDRMLGDEKGLDAHRQANPQFYAELQGGWYDGWGGPGYERVRELLGADALDNVTKAALSQRATLWNYYMFSGGVTWGYMASPDVYSSYDYGAPIGESGRTGPAYQAVLRLNEFLDRFEDDLAQTERVEPHTPWCREHLLTRQGPHRRFVYLRNPRRRATTVPASEAERSTLGPRETQIRVYDAGGALEAVSPELPAQTPPPPPPSQPLPALSSWSFAGASPQLEPAYDDADWDEIPDDAVELNRMDIDALGVHYGCIWYRGTFSGPLDRLQLDARHCWAVWINGALVAQGDQFQNTLGVGPDGARLSRIPLRRASFVEGKNTIVILVESLGHNKGFADDAANPRGIVRIDAGGTPVQWRFRGGLVRGEQGMNPVVALEGVERSGSQQVALPHGWEGEPHGVGLYETRFALAGIDPKNTALGLAFDPGRGKANVYLNGYLIGRYWPERGPQRRFFLPWGVLEPDGENQLAIAVWKRTPRAALGAVRLELM